MLMRYLRVAAITILCLFASIRVSVQGFPSEPDMTIDASTRDAVIDGVLKELTDYYVFPDTAARMTQSIWQRRQRREYDAITSGRTLAEVLTAHLRERSGDRHSFHFPRPHLHPRRSRMRVDSITGSRRSIASRGTLGISISGRSRLPG
ncbi:MAG: hypothetical protein DMG00_00525 [Acidobacteria bacterium]|nr:MAG: hypothetical protein DMG00_00525 [Acidobacteriota bacterium]